MCLQKKNTQKPYVSPHIHPPNKDQGRGEDHGRGEVVKDQGRGEVGGSWGTGTFRELRGRKKDMCPFQEAPA